MEQVGGEGQEHAHPSLEGSRGWAGFGLTQELFKCTETLMGGRRQRVMKRHGTIS